MPTELQLAILSELGVAEVVRTKRLNSSYKSLIDTHEEHIGRTIAARHRQRINEDLEALDFGDIDILTALISFDRHYDAYGSQDLACRSFGSLYQDQNPEKFATTTQPTAPWKIKAFFFADDCWASEPQTVTEGIARTLMRMQQDVICSELWISDITKTLPYPEKAELEAALASGNLILPAQKVEEMYRTVITKRPFGHGSGLSQRTHWGYKGSKSLRQQTSANDRGQIQRALNLPRLGKFHGVGLHYRIRVGKQVEPTMSRALRLVNQMTSTGRRVSDLGKAALFEDVFLGLAHAGL
ncbi:hypothetical protein LTR85_006839 [Meristemomyces frigidus]|nr:hypothetical protein LTR85_006839 [Meristemomyces frigidus]